MDSKSLPAGTEELTEKYLSAVTEALNAAKEKAKKWRKVPILGLLFFFIGESYYEGAQYEAVAFDPAKTPEQLCQQIFPDKKQNNTLEAATHIQIRFIVDGETIAMHFPGIHCPVYDENAAPLVKLPAWSAD